MFLLWVSASVVMSRSSNKTDFGRPHPATCIMTINLPQSDPGFIKKVYVTTLQDHERKIETAFQSDQSA